MTWNITNPLHTMKKSDKSVLLCFLGIVIAFFGCDFIVEHTADSYYTFSQGWWATGVATLTNNGRIILGLFYFVFELFNISVDIAYYISYALAIIFLTASLYVLFKLVNDHINNVIYSAIISLGVILNPFVVEYFTFFEKGMFFLSILFVVLASDKFVSFLKTRSVRQLVYTGILLILSAFTYQSVVALFVCICFPFLKYYLKSIKHYIFGVMLCGCGYGVAGAANLIFIKLVAASVRLESAQAVGTVEESTRSSLFEYIFEAFERLFISCLDIIPKGIFIVAILLSVAISIIAIIKSGKDIIFQIVNGAAMIMVCGVCSVFPFLMGVAGFSARVIYPIGGLAGIICLNYALNIDSREDTNDNRTYRSVACFAIILLLIVQLFAFNKILVDKHKNHALDQYRTLMIGQAIEEYEQESGITIQSIAFYYEDQLKPQYPGLFSTGDLVISAYTTRWSDIYIINYYLGTNYTLAEPNSEYLDMFEQNSETVFCLNDQLIFDEDVLHILIY